MGSSLRRSREAAISGGKFETEQIVMDARPVEQWTEIFGKLPAPNGVDADKLMAERVIGDLIGYEHPSGSAPTRARRQERKTRDAEELRNAMIAFARIYFDAGVRP